MSPAVSTATASAAAAIAPSARRSVTVCSTRAGPKSSRADSSSSGSTAHRPTPAIKTTQGKAASACTTAAPKRPTRIGRTPSACIRPALPKRPARPSHAAAAARTPPARSSPAAAAGRSVGAEQEERQQDARAAARSPRSSSTSPASRARAAAGGASPPDSRSMSDHAAGSSAVPVLAAVRSRDRRVLAQASCTVASAGQPTTASQADARERARRQRDSRIRLTSRNPAARIRAAVFSYASSTHSTILSGSGEYSSSIEIAASGMSSCLIASRYGGKSTTPRPGGRSPWTLPSQSEMCT